MTTKKGLDKDPKLATKLDKAVFPGLQGGPHNNTTAGIAIAMTEADTKMFKNYAENVVTNAKVLAEELNKLGFKLSSNGTDTHLILIDVTPKKVDGWSAAWALDYAGIVTNRNAIPFDTRTPYYPSGLRIGTPAITTRGMGSKEMKQIANWINEVINIAANYYDKQKMDSEDKTIKSKSRKDFRKILEQDKRILEIAKEVKVLCDEFPIDL